MKVVLNVPREEEGCRYPYWLIIDPWQNMGCTVEGVTDKLKGPFFCRGAAERYLSKHGYQFSERVKIVCLSGEDSLQYKNAFCEEDET